MARFVTVAGVLALAAVLLAGCGGGGDDHAKVEASLQHYLDSLVAEEGAFPIGAGAPRVKDNSCKERHGTERFVFATLTRTIKSREGLPLWACVVKFGTYPMPVVAAVDDGTEVVVAIPKHGAPATHDPPTSLTSLNAFVT
jgi:hypothetical protein